MNECKMSLFQNPIAPQRDPQGRILKAATLTPAMEVTPADVYQLITCNEPLRLATYRCGTPPTYAPPKPPCCPTSLLAAYSPAATAARC